jgi:hypothetical protein
MEGRVRSVQNTNGIKEILRVNVHLINPSHVSFGTAVITPRWRYVLAGAIPRRFGDPILVDETLSQMGPGAFSPVTQWASAFTLQMRSVATNLGIWPASGVRTSFLAEFTPPSIPKKPGA